MKKLINAVIAVLVVTAIGITTPLPAQAKYMGHSATPTELRGNWYRYEGNNKWQHIKINKHSYVLNGKVLCSLNKKGVKKLHVMQYKQGGRPYYILNKFNFHYQEIGAFWLSKSKIHGRRVMKSYYNMGYFSVYTRSKIKHDYSYEVKGDFNKSLGK